LIQTRHSATFNFVRAGKGSNTNPILIFVKNMLDVLDKEEMEEYYVLMVNFSIHEDKHVPDYIETRGHIPWLLPPYSPFINPIDEF
ncbi:hypothetical protein K501DRAFT_200461, partial [Backusella circina FSU 941]